MTITLRNWLIEHFLSIGLNAFYAELICVFILLAIAICLGFLIDKVVRTVLLRGFVSIAKTIK